MAITSSVFSLTRRRALTALPSLATLAAPRWLAAPARAETTSGDYETHGLSPFGELGEKADFPHFGYVNSSAPKGGIITLTTQAPTFDSLNGYVLRGNPAQGLSLIFDSLMTSSLDEPDALYGLVAKSVRVSADKLVYRFFLRREARFHDGSRLTAEDVAFSLNILKTKGHPVIAQMLRDLKSAEPEAEDIVVVRFAPGRTRDLPLIVAGQPIFSKKFYSSRAFEESTLEPPLGSGAYKIGAFEQGRFNVFERAPDYWGKNLPVNVGQNNFDKVRYEYFSDSNVAFEAFKGGAYTLRQEDTARIWATGYDFPAIREGRVKRETFPSTRIPGIQGWYFNTRRAAFADPRVREAIGYAFDYEWTNRNLMYDAYKRISSFFENSELAANGLPDEAQKALLEPFRDRLPADAFGEAVVPPVSDGSGQDRNLLRKANDLLAKAGCVRKNNTLFLPDGKPFEIEFLYPYNLFERHTQPFVKNLKLLGIDGRIRIVDAAQYKQRLENFDYDLVVGNLVVSFSPGEELRNYYGSDAAKFHGSHNLAGIADPAVDALVDKAMQANSRAELVTICRALDRVLRAGRYMIPHWYTPVTRIARWDVFDRPARTPKYDVGIVSTWWWDEEKARKINFTGR